ncbi:MAG TPA: TonB-dependent receptor [Ohtaekwangia sp.]|nr:TonB-dependent receptor [Ohtaekwangia sp.]
MNFKSLRTSVCLLCAIFCVLTRLGYAQNQYVLRGSVSDDQQVAVPFANAALYAGGTLVTGAASDADGRFEIAVAPGTYDLKITFLSFEEKIITGITVTDSDIDVGNVVLSPNVKLLQEVVVEGERSQMELHLDKRIFNVAQDLSNIGGNAADILNNIPSVTVDIEGNVALRGSQNVRILIDGKPSGLVGISSTDALRQLQGDMIERVEVITNPSSRYDAEGEVGIINIILKKNASPGLNGTVTATAGHPANYATSFNLNYKKNKVNFFTGYGINYRSNPGRGSSTQAYNSNDTSFMYLQSSERTRSGLSHNFRFGADYSLSEKTSVSASILYRNSAGLNKSTLTYRDLDEQGTVVRTSERSEREEEPETNIEASLGFRKEFEQKGRSLAFDAKWVLSDEVEKADYREGTENGNDLILQRAYNTEVEKNGLLQLDYIHPLGGKAQVEAGLKSTWRVINNEFALDEFQNASGWNTIPAFNNNLIFTERVHAGYLMASNQHNKFFYQAGLRGEFSDVTTELTESDERNNRRYFNLFPSIHLSYKIAERKTAQLSYSYRISRPRFRDLIPFSNFSDSRVFNTGNPALNPEYTHSVEAGYLLDYEKGTLLSSVYYRYRMGVVQRISNVVDSSGLTVVVPVNLATQNAYGFEFNFSYDLADWWRLNTSANLYRAITEGNHEGERLYSDTYTVTGRVTSRMTFFRKIDFQTSVNYRAPRVTPQGKDLAMYSIDLNLARDIFKGKGTITAGVRDLLNSQKRRSITEFEGYYSRSTFQWRLRQYLVTFTYRINRNKERQRDEPERGSEPDDEF